MMIELMPHSEHEQRPDIPNIALELSPTTCLHNDHTSQVSAYSSAGKYVPNVSSLHSFGLAWSVTPSPCSWASGAECLDLLAVGYHEHNPYEIFVDDFRRTIRRIEWQYSLLKQWKPHSLLGALAKVEISKSPSIAWVAAA